MRIANRFRRLDRVGENKFLESRGGNSGDCSARKYAVGDVDIDFPGALSQQSNGGVAQGTPRIDDVTNQNAGLAGNVTNDIHDFQVTGAFAALINDSEWCVYAFCEGAGAKDASNVGGDHNDVVEFQPLLDVVDLGRSGIKIICGYIEEALDLAGVMIDRKSGRSLCDATEPR